MTIAAHLTETDPLDLADPGVINLIGYTPSTPRGILEALDSSGKGIPSAIKELKPLDQFELVYQLLDTASLVLPLGVAVNTDYLITAISCKCGPDKYPEVNVTVIKPSAATLIKAYSGSITVTLVGGMGVVNKFGATSTASFVTSDCSISMQSLDAMNETSGDFETDGIYRFNFKEEVTCEAYAAITAPAGAHAITNEPATPKQSPDGWQIYSKSFWTYLDPWVAPTP